MASETDKSNAPTIEKQKQEVEPPKMWQVVMYNDDYTPMDFVILILSALYQKNPQEAFDLTMAIHNEGKTVVTTVPHDIATTKCAETIASARANGFPLYCEAREEPAPQKKRGNAP